MPSLWGITLNPEFSVSYSPLPAERLVISPSPHGPCIGEHSFILLKCVEIMKKYVKNIKEKAEGNL